MQKNYFKSNFVPLKKGMIVNMKIYIDFDHTLYNTNALISDMINCIANYIFVNGDFEKYPENFKKAFPNLDVIPMQRNLNSITGVLRNNFKRPKDTTLKIKYNVFALAEKFAELFSCDYEGIETKIDETLGDGQKYLYDDSVKFLRDLKEDGNEVYILSHEGNDLSFQNKKIRGAGVFRPDLLNATIVTKESKAELDNESINDPEKTSINVTSLNYARPEEVDYEHGIFIDDRPKDLEKLYSSAYKNQQPPFRTRIYRIARENGTYSKNALNVPYSGGVKKVENLMQISNILNVQMHADEDEREMKVCFKVSC